MQLGAMMPARPLRAIGKIIAAEIERETHIAMTRGIDEEAARFCAVQIVESRFGRGSRPPDDYGLPPPERPTRRPPRRRPLARREIVS